MALHVPDSMHASRLELSLVSHRSVPTPGLYVPGVHSTQSSTCVALEAFDMFEELPDNREGVDLPAGHAWQATLASPYVPTGQGR